MGLGKALGKPLTIAFFYESFSVYRSRGYSFEDCVELDKDETIDAITSALRRNGFHVIPVGDIQELVKCLAKGEHEQWDLAFSISEGMHGVAREAQVPALLEAYRIPHVFSDAATLALCLDKGKTKMILEQKGIQTAPFTIIPASWPNNDPTSGAISQLLEESPHAGKLRKFPLFIKPACEGSSKGIYPFSKVNSPSELENGLQTLQGRFPGQSILIETYLTGREYTISMLGSGSSSRVLGTIHQDWQSMRANKQQNGHKGTAAATESPFASGFFNVNNKNESEKDELHHIIDDRDDPEVKAAESLALRAWRALECRDVGRVDVRCGEDGQPYILELNPLPGLRPRWSALAETALHAGLSHEALLDKVFESALERYPELQARRRDTRGDHV